MLCILFIIQVRHLPLGKKIALILFSRFAMITLSGSSASELRYCILLCNSNLFTVVLWKVVETLWLYSVTWLKQVGMKLWSCSLKENKLLPNRQISVLLTWRKTNLDLWWWWQTNMLWSRETDHGTEQQTGDRCAPGSAEWSWPPSMYFWHSFSMTPLHYQKTMQNTLNKRSVIYVEQFFFFPPWH